MQVFRQWHLVAMDRHHRVLPAPRQCPGPGVLVPRQAPLQPLVPSPELRQSHLQWVSGSGDVPVLGLQLSPSSTAVPCVPWGSLGGGGCAA